MVSALALPCLFCSRTRYFCPRSFSQWKSTAASLKAHLRLHVTGFSCLKCRWVAAGGLFGAFDQAAVGEDVLDPRENGGCHEFRRHALLRDDVGDALGIGLVGNFLTEGREVVLAIGDLESSSARRFSPPQIGRFCQLTIHYGSTGVGFTPCLFAGMVRLTRVSDPSLKLSHEVTSLLSKLL